MFVALIVFSFPHGFLAARNIRKRSEVQHISPLISASSVTQGWRVQGPAGEKGRGKAQKKQQVKMRHKENKH